MNATSSSDRYDAARKALTEHGHRDATPEDPGSIAQLTVALRSLIEPAATEEGPEEIADSVIFVSGPENKKVKDDVAGAMMGDGQALRRVILAAVHAGIQAAWESWESDDYAPTLCDKCGADADTAESTAPAFKPSEETDYYRAQWEDIANAGGDPFRVKLTAPDAETNWLRVTPDQARRILEMLSSEASA